MAAESRLERIADGRTDLVWVHVAEGGLAAAGASRGRPLIEWCAYYGDVSAIRFLLDYGCIHPGRKPMALSLLGWPRGASARGGPAR